MSETSYLENKTNVIGHLGLIESKHANVYCNRRYVSRPLFLNLSLRLAELFSIAQIEFLNQIHPK